MSTILKILYTCYVVLDDRQHFLSSIFAFTRWLSFFTGFIFVNSVHFTIAFFFYQTAFLPL
ncbi:hypothetical protein P175DRAFT_077551 [Aspergillus ochraceoroseus IBT 24754]|uniref:Uncharacterized protein n=1 Tax=Aspergillus ochraceoroseus IBT 24754 TaxID=1392256 RepID=A0A2T5MA40_9EURO|nr:uncharacterized protein P175DRAFT_077551 [Aspergillus ochraceoroseus IBT 24754]PTU25390.1 hypothetical protein P175DRAFT_077551 [Aspergillus ochraceoroseus IBT 24754]